MKSKRIIFFLLLLVLLILVARKYFIAALVNGKPISRMAIISDLEKRGGKQVLDSLISKELILQEATRKKVTVNSNEITKKTKEIEASTAKQGQKLDQLLAFQGMTREQFNEQLRVQLLLEKILTDKIKVSNKEVDEYLKKMESENAVSQISPAPKQPSRNEVRDQLRQQKLQKEAEVLVERLKKAAKISRFVNY